jgi:hypothetical protein
VTAGPSWFGWYRRRVCRVQVVQARDDDDDDDDDEEEVSVQAAADPGPSWGCLH